MNTIADVDPDLHAGLQYDANRGNGDGRSLGSLRHVRQTTQQDARPVSAHEVDELQRDWNESSEQHTRRNSNNHARQRPMVKQVKHPEADHLRIPCPHANCSGFASRKFRTIARQNEKDSELANHLLHEHRITPFPCVEADCRRTRENGFFRQHDLELHVMRAHSSSTVRRKSRPHPREMYIDLTDDSPSSKDIKKSTSEAGSVKGNVIFPPQTDAASIDTDPTSSSRMVERTPRATTSTPLTSFSSVAVQPPSIVQKAREIRDSHEPDALSSSMGTSSQIYSAARKASPDLGELQSNVPASPNLSHQQRIESDDIDSSLPTPMNVSDQSQRQKSHNLAPLSDGTPIMTRRRSMALTPLECSSPQTNQRACQKEKFTRNVIPASHTFSDDEEPQPTRISPAPTLIQRLSERPATKTPLPATPSSRKKTSKNPLHRVLSQQEDLDELSLGPDDFKIISTRTRSTPEEVFGSVRIKRETSIFQTLPSTTKATTTTKKRRFSEILAAEEVDELGADAIFGHSAGPSKRIKRETTVDLNTTPMVHRVKVQRKQTKQAYREEARKSGIDLPIPNHVRSSSIIRASTPLLDLTPTTSRVIVDSTNRSGGKVISGLLTPTRNAKAAPAIVVKTPGGTYRKCGEGEFRCGRSFCFRCGSKTTVAAM